jgi:hypothetical protein
MVVARRQRQLLSVLAKVKSGVQLLPLQFAAALGPQVNRLRAVLLSKNRVLSAPDAVADNSVDLQHGGFSRGRGLCLIV